MSTATIRIAGMHCDGCAQRVQRVLEKEPGVEKARVSYTDGEAQVQYDGETVTPSRLHEVIERAGYTAQSAA